MTRKEIVNSFDYQAANEAVSRYQDNQELDIDSFEDGARYGYTVMYDKAIEFLKNLQGKPEDGVARFIWFEEIIDVFKDFGL